MDVSLPPSHGASSQKNPVRIRDLHAFTMHDDVARQARGDHRDFFDVIDELRGDTRPITSTSHVDSGTSGTPHPASSAAVANPFVGKKEDQKPASSRTKIPTPLQSGKEGDAGTGDGKTIVAVADDHIVRRDYSPTGKAVQQPTTQQREEIPPFIKQQSVAPAPVVEPIVKEEQSLAGAQLRPLGATTASSSRSSWDERPTVLSSESAHPKTPSSRIVRKIIAGVLIFGAVGGIAGIIAMGMVPLPLFLREVLNYTEYQKSPNGEQPLPEKPPLTEALPLYLKVSLDDRGGDLTQKMFNVINASLVGATDPVEFVVVDEKTMAPVPLSVFMDRMGVAIPADLQKFLSEDFSLFFVDDGGRRRFAFSFSLVDTLSMATSQDIAAVRDMLVAAESALLTLVKPFYVSFLSIDVATLRACESVQSMEYALSGSRYCNFEEGGTLSFDYVLIPSVRRILVSTSKVMHLTLVTRLSASQ